VYVINIERDLTKQEYQHLLTQVSAEKRERITRFRNTADKKRSLLGELLARSAIAKELAIPTNEIFLTKNQHGKPVLRDYPEMHFNISHAGQHVVCAVSDVPVGIDVEQIGRRDFIKIANRFFCADEKAYVKSFTSDVAQAAVFAEIWTKKEAYIKRDGRGLAVPLTSFSVLSVPDIFFHRIDIGPDAMCHVCSVQPDAPKIVRHPVDEFISLMFRSNLLQNL
jgi:4'-phosphopantetheinyl transferase